MKKSKKWYEEKIDELMKQNDLPDHSNTTIQDWDKFRKGAIMGYRAGYAKKVYQDTYWEESFKYWSEKGTLGKDFEKGWRWGHKHGSRMRKETKKK